MVEITFTSSVGEYQAGQKYKVTKGRANYFIRTGKAVLAKDYDCGCAPKAPIEVKPVIIKAEAPKKTVKKTTKTTKK